MADLEKIFRTLKFISGARVITIYKQLEEGGFTEAELAHGIRLLETAATLAREPRQAPKDNANLIVRCEEFQRRWYRPVRAALTRSFPQMAEDFFNDFTVETGTRAVLSVTVFLKKLEALAAGKAPFGQDGPKARELLTVRKLTAEVESEGLALVAELSNTTELKEVPERALKLEAAIDELWAWYLDWSSTAQTLVTSKSHRRALGFGRSQSKLDDEAAAQEVISPPRLTESPTRGAASGSPGQSVNTQEGATPSNDPIAAE
jgi:hypothetical protein